MEALIVATLIMNAATIVLAVAVIVWMVRGRR